MGNIGSGAGSGYPTALDYQSSPEVNSPSAGMTKSRAEVPNDLAAAVIATQTALGVNPQGTKTDVKTYLQTEHNPDGTHKTLSCDITGNAATATLVVTKYAKISDVKSNSTNGGTFTQGAWRTRDLNTEDSDSNGIVSIASNKITLQAGTYIIRASAPGGAVGGHQARLQNTTDATTVLLGTTERVVGSVAVTTRSHIVGQFTIDDTKAFEIQHYCTTSNTDTGFGYSLSVGTSEVYTVVELWKIL